MTEKYGHLIELPNYKDVDKKRDPINTKGFDPQLNNSQDNLSPFGFLKELLVSAIPSIVQLFSFLLATSMTLHFLCKVDCGTFYNGIGTGITWQNFFNTMLISSLNSGLIALASQSIGNKRYYYMGLTLHRTLIVHGILNTFTYFLCFFAAEIFIWIGFEPEVAELAEEYLRGSPTVILSMIVYDTLKNYLYSMGIFIPQVIIQILITCAHYLWLQFFMIYLNLGTEGIILAMTIMPLTGAVCLYIYIQFKNPYEETWFPFEEESKEEIMPTLTSLVEIGSMIYFELFVYNVLLVFAGVLDKTSMEAFLAFTAIDALFYVIPMGYSLPLTSFIGNAAGEGRKDKLKTVVKSAFTFGVIVEGICMLAFYLMIDPIAKFHTEQPDALEVVKSLCKWYLVLMPADFFQCQLGSILKGIGKEWNGFLITLICFYCIGVPLAWFFCFEMKLGLQGMWYGLTIALYLIVICFLIDLIRTDYDRQIADISQKLDMNERLSMHRRDSIRSRAQSLNASQVSAPMPQLDKRYHSQQPQLNMP